MAAQDYADQFLDSISILLNKKIEAIKFDETKTAIITNADQAEKGIYQVTEDQITRYQAYSAVTEYKVNDAVLVTIPQGNYDNQKIIVGKAVSGSDSPIIYTPPFASMVDISNNIITTNLGEKEMWANGPTYKWPIDIQKFPGENEDLPMKCIWDSNDSSLAYADSLGNHLNLTGYSIIGLQAQVATYLGEYNTILGNYGLALEIVFRYASASIEEQQKSFSKFITFDSSEYFGNIYSFDSYYTQESVYDISDYNQFAIDRIKLYMYQRNNFKDKNGERVPAPENDDDFFNIAPNIIFKDFYICLGVPAEGFETDTIKLISNNGQEYYKDTQELSMEKMIADLSINNTWEIIEQGFSIATNKTNIIIFKENPAPTITIMDLQRIIANSDNPLEIYEAIIQIHKLNLPIQIATPEDKLSYINKYGLSRLNDDYEYNTLLNLQKAFNTLKEYLGSRIGRDYYNVKEIEAIWLHKDDSTGIIAKVEDEALPMDYSIQWYRYKLGAPSPDMFAGAHWVRFYGCRREHDDKWDYCITEQELAAENSELEDIATDSILVDFIPNINESQEQIKAIILYNEQYDSQGHPTVQRYITQSEPITFTNLNDVRSQATVIDLNTLAIRIDDEEQGKYFLYNRADELDEEEANEIRVLTAVFDPNEPDVYKKAELTEFTSIEWIFPTSSTMIRPATDATIGAVPASTNVFTNVTKVGYFINKHLDRQASNNTVRLKVMRNGISWEAEVSLLFGTAGTSGSDYTLILNWKNINQALDVTYPGWDSLHGEVGLQDRTGKYIPIPADSKVEYDWLVGEVMLESNLDDYEFIPEDRDLYYPIFENLNDAIFDPNRYDSEKNPDYDNSESNPFLKTMEVRVSDESTYGGYYYYLDSNYSDVCKALTKKIGQTITYNKNSNHFIKIEGTLSTEEINAIGYVPEIAYFDLNDNKYKSMSEDNLTFDVLTGKVVCGSTPISQFYRKRKNSGNISKSKIVNIDEQFFKIIYQKNNSNNIYDEFFSDTNYWPKDNGKYLIQNKDNIINIDSPYFYLEEEQKTISEYFLEFLNELEQNLGANPSITDFNNELTTWITNMRNTRRIFYINGQIDATFDTTPDNNTEAVQALEKILVELVFNIHNIYEHVLKIKTSGDAHLPQNTSYYYYNNEYQEFRDISELTFQNFIDYKGLIYELSNEDTQNLKYEFSKPKIEYSPLTLFNLTNSFAQTDHPSQAINNSGKIFETDIQSGNKDKSYYQEIYKTFFNVEGTLDPEDNSAYSDFLDGYINDLKSKNNQVGYTNNLLGKKIEDRAYFKSPNNPMGKNHLDDYLTIKAYYLYLNGNSSRWITDFEVSSESLAKQKFYDMFVNELSVSDLKKYFDENNQSIKSNISNELIYAIDIDSFNIYSSTYRNIYNELKTNESSLNEYFDTNLSLIINNENAFYTKETVNLSTIWPDIYKYLVKEENNIAANARPSLSLTNDGGIGKYFYENTSNNTHHLKLKLITQLSTDKYEWLIGDTYVSDLLRTPGTNLVSFYNTYIIGNNEIRSLIAFPGNDISNEEIFYSNYINLITNIFEINNVESVQNRIRGNLLQKLINVTSAISQSESYNELKSPTDILKNNGPLNEYKNKTDEENNYIYKDLYFETSDQNLQYRNIFTYLSEQLGNFNSTTSTPIADTLSLYKIIYNTINQKKCIKITTTSSLSNFYQILNQLLFIEENNSLPIETKISKELITNSEEQSVLVIDNNNVYFYNSDINCTITEPVFDSFTSTSTIIYDAIKNSLPTNAYLTKPSSPENGAEVRTVTKIYNIKDIAGNNFFSNFNFLRKNMNSPIYSFTYSYSRQIYNANTGNWVNSTNNFATVSGIDEEKNITLLNGGLYFTETSLYDILGYSNIANGENQYQLLLLLRCINGFVHKGEENYYNLKLADNLDNEQILLRIDVDSENSSIYYYNDVANDYNNLSINMNNYQLKSFSTFLLQKYFYENAISKPDSTQGRSTYTKASIFTSKSYYKGTLDDAYLPLKLLYLLFMKNVSEATDIPISEISAQLFVDEDLFWKYFAGNFSTTLINDNTYIKDIIIPDSSNIFNNFLINDNVVQSLSFDYNSDVSQIEYYIRENLQYLKQRTCEQYDVGEYTGELKNSLLELQQKYYKEQAFKFLSNFYSNLTNQVSVNTKVTDPNEKTNFKTFVYNFLSNEGTTENVDSKLAEYFNNNNNNKIYHLLNLSLVENYEFDTTLILTDTENSKSYNLAYILRNINTADRLYNVLTQLANNKITINDLSTVESNSWDAIWRLTKLEMSDYIELLQSYFEKIPSTASLNKEEKLITLFSNYGENNLDVQLTKYSPTYKSTKYKLYYLQTDHNFEDPFEQDSDQYITAKDIINIYENIYKKAGIYYSSAAVDIENLDEQQIKRFNYYNADKKKAFIKVDGFFILDPYDEWLEGETYYEPVQVNQYKCKVPPLRYSSSSLKDTTTNTLVEVYPRLGLTSSELMNSISILKVTLTNFGNYDLISCYPIALRNNTQTNEYGQITWEAKYINGATEVRYTSGGTTDYNNNPYRMFIRKFSATPEKDLTSDIVIDPNKTYYKINSGVFTIEENPQTNLLSSYYEEFVGNRIIELRDNISQQDIIGTDNENAWNWGILIPANKKYNYKTGNFIPSISKRLLQPSPVYIPNLGGYGVQYINNQGTILWTQPIWAYEDNYPSSTLNAWNGEDILTDNDTGTIVASAIAAGKKENDNTFSGVILGDWSRSDTDSFITKQTGLYGFYHGSMSYAFKDDGTGFIGKDGRGRIYFNGTDSTIYSSEWIGNEPLGMMLDIDDGIIKLQAKDFTNLDTTDDSLYDSIPWGATESLTVQGETHSVTVQATDFSEEDLTSNRYKYITLSASENRYPLSIGTSKNSGSRKFRVAWDGTTYITNGVFSGVLHGKGGILDGNFIVQGQLYGGEFVGGEVYSKRLVADNGLIGGWTITNYGLVNSDKSTVLLSNTANLAEELPIDNPDSISLVTNRILISTNTKNVINEAGQFGRLAMEIGHVYGLAEPNKPTEGMGIFSNQKLIFHSTGERIALRSANTAYVEGFYQTNGAAAIMIGGANHTGHWPEPKDSSGTPITNGYITIDCQALVVKAPATAQSGIYARFA